jgi:tryptophan-rich sensory protein
MFVVVVVVAEAMVVVATAAAVHVNTPPHSKNKDIFLQFYVFLYYINDQWKFLFFKFHAPPQPTVQVPLVENHCPISL